MKLNSFIKRPLAVAVTTGGLLMAASFALQADDTGKREQQSGTQVQVEERPAQVEYEQGATEVTADQKPLDVQVETDEPRVSVEQAEPQVTVEQAKPEVTVEEAEPRVVVEEAEPQVEVVQEKPEVEVNEAVPNVEVVSKDERGQLKEEQNQQAQVGQSLMHQDLAELRDTAVKNNAGEDLGSVQDIVVSRDGRETGFVISVGGVLGVADKRVFVPASEAQLQDDTIVWQSAQTKKQIESSANYNPDQYYSVAEKEGTLTEAKNAVAASGQSPR